MLFQKKPLLFLGVVWRDLDVWFSSIVLWLPLGRPVPRTPQAHLSLPGEISLPTLPGGLEKPVEKYTQRGTESITEIENKQSW